MRSYRFLTSRRWVLFLVAILLTAYATWWLGQWQFDRLAERKDRNEVIRTNEAREPAPVAEVLAPGRSVAADQEWRLITATGTYDTSETVIVRYRSRDGVPGVDAVVPLVTSGGTAVVVDRGFLATDARQATVDDVPAPPSGEVTITGWVRADGTGDSTRVADLSTRAISSVEIGAAWDRTVYGGFVDLASESPEPATPLQTTELPDLDNGPHFFYGLQWWFFGLLALFGFGYLAYDERKLGPRGERERTRKPRSSRADSDRARVAAATEQQTDRS